MSVLQRGVIKSYSGGSHRAAVQVAGSLAVWLESVPVATDVAPAEVQAGRECAVLFFDESNPEDAVIVCVYGAVPAGGGGIQNKIADADANTLVETEKNANEDKVRITVGGTERGLFQTASPHVTLTGDARIDGLVGLNGAVQAGEMLRVGAPAGTYTTNLVLIKAQPITNPTIGANNLSFQGIAGAPVAVIGAGPYTGLALQGLLFTLGVNAGGAGTVIASMELLDVQALLSNFTGTVTQLTNVAAKAPIIAAGVPSVTLSVGVDIGNMGPSNKIVDAVALQIADITTNTGYRRLIEAGPATPNLRLEANAPSNPGAGFGRTQLLLACNENGVVTLRRVEWEDFATLAAGDKMLKAV